MNVTVTPVIEPLLHIYSGQGQPQPCFVELDLRTGELSAGWSAEIGNGMPYDVWLGLVRQYRIPPLQPETVNQLMEQIRPYAQTIVDHTEIEWDGSNWRPKFDSAAIVAEEEIDGNGTEFIVTQSLNDEEWHDGIVGILFELESDVYWYDAQDWWSPWKDDIKEEFRSGRTVDELYNQYQSDGRNEGMPILIGLYDYLEMLQEEVEEEDNG